MTDVSPWLVGAEKKHLTRSREARGRETECKKVLRESSQKHTHNEPQQSFYKDRPVLGQDRQDRTCRDKGSPEGGG